MTQKDMNSKLQGTATFYHLIMSALGTVVFVTFFIVMMKAEISANRKDIDGQQKALEKMGTDIKEQNSESKKNQLEIIQTLNEIKLQLKDKQDRK